jgi:hypothetical protein
MAFTNCAIRALAAFVVAPLLFAAAPMPIGIATSESDFRTGSAVVKGQATLFEGDGVQSLELATRLRLKDGSRYVLGVGSNGTVHRDRVVLRSGSVELTNLGRPARVVASNLTVLADNPGTAASVYVSGRDLVTVVTRRGEVKVVPTSGGPAKIVRAGETLALKAGARGQTKALEPADALAELNRVQADQLEQLTEVGQDYTCMEPTVSKLSVAFASLSTQIVANQASRSAIQIKLDRGAATPTDLQQLSRLNDGLRGLQQASVGMSAELDGAVFQFHHPGPTGFNGSEHTVHGHLDVPHHGLHGHSVGPSGGDHQNPPHCFGDPLSPPCIVP